MTEISLGVDLRGRRRLTAEKASSSRRWLQQRAKRLRPVCCAPPNGDPAPDASVWPCGGRPAPAPPRTSSRRAANESSHAEEQDCPGDGRIVGYRPCHRADLGARGRPGGGVGCQCRGRPGDSRTGARGWWRGDFHRLGRWRERWCRTAGGAGHGQVRPTGRGLQQRGHRGPQCRTGGLPAGRLGTGHQHQFVRRLPWHAGPDRGHAQEWRRLDHQHGVGTGCGRLCRLTGLCRRQAWRDRPHPGRGAGVQRPGRAGECGRPGLHPYRHDRRP